MVRALSSSSIRNCRFEFQNRQLEMENGHNGLLGAGSLGSLARVARAACRGVRLFDVDLEDYIAIQDR